MRQASGIKVAGGGMVVCLVLVTLALLVPAPALAAPPLCEASSKTTTIRLHTTQATALRLQGKNGHIQYVAGPAATGDLTNANWKKCPGESSTASTNGIFIKGTRGIDNLRIVADVNWDRSSFVTFVNLTVGSDKIDFTVGTPGQGLNVGLGIGQGQRLVDLDYFIDSNFTYEVDMRLTNIEQVLATGYGDAPDSVVAQGCCFNSKASSYAPYSLPGMDPEQGFDLPVTFSGADELDGFAPGEGDDVFLAGMGDDSVYYYDAPAAVHVDLEAGSASGGSGNDTLDSVSNATGTAFSDELLGTSETNNIGGYGGDDWIDARDGDDIVVTGVDGESTIYQGTQDDGADLLDPNDGTIDYGDRTTNLFIEKGELSGAGSCPEVPATCEGDMIQDSALANEETTFIAGSGNDRLIGSIAADTFYAGAGDDAITGGDGDDVLDGGDGRDSGDGGNGTDSCVNVEAKVACES